VCEACRWAPAGGGDGRCLSALYARCSGPSEVSAVRHCGLHASYEPHWFVLFGVSSPGLASSVRFSPLARWSRVINFPNQLKGPVHFFSFFISLVRGVVYELPAQSRWVGGLGVMTSS